MYPEKITEKILECCEEKHVVKTVLHVFRTWNRGLPEDKTEGFNEEGT